MAPKSFKAKIETGNKGGAFVTIPFNVEKNFGRKGQVKVKASFDGHEYRGSLAPMGGGTHILGVRKDIRSAIKKDIGDTVAVTLQLDTEKRTVTVPPTLAAALRKRAGAKKQFDSLSYTRRREYAESVAGAKKEETRTRRIAKILDELDQ